MARRRRRAPSATRAAVKALVAVCDAVASADVAEQAHAAAGDAVLAFGHADWSSRRCLAAVQAERAARTRLVEAYHAVEASQARCKVLQGMCLGSREDKWGRTHMGQMDYGTSDGGGRQGCRNILHFNFRPAVGPGSLECSAKLPKGS